MDVKYRDQVINKRTKTVFRVITVNPDYVALSNATNCRAQRVTHEQLDRLFEKLIPSKKVDE